MLLVVLVEDYVGQIREVAQVVIKGADQAVINVVRHGAVASKKAVISGQA